MSESQSSVAPEGDVLHLEGADAVRFQELYEERALTLARIHILNKRRDEYCSEIEHIDKEMQELAAKARKQ